eukprot:11153151-Alexandrium_andersonii.AAC.1
MAKRPGGSCRAAAGAPREMAQATKGAAARVRCRTETPFARAAAAREGNFANFERSRAAVARCCRRAAA